MMVGGGGLWLSWGRPSKDQQKACIANSAGAFNYDPHFHGTSSSSSPPQEELSKKGGFSVNRSRILLGSGPATFHRAKSAVLSWRHFQLGWAFVEPDTPIAAGTSFCVCVKELLPWVMMPLRVAYVTDVSRDSKPSGGATMDGVKASFGFGSGTLRGHFLAGEERFSVAWDENDKVWYEIFSFSKPAHPLSFIAYPYVQLRQKYFAHESTQAVLKHVAAQQSEN